MQKGLIARVTGIRLQSVALISETISGVSNRGLLCLVSSISDGCAQAQCELRPVQLVGLFRLMDESPHQWHSVKTTRD
jgi:hypothetical protein